MPTGEMSGKRKWVCIGDFSTGELNSSNALNVIKVRMTKTWTSLEACIEPLLGTYHGTLTFLQNISLLFSE